VSTLCDGSTCIAAGSSFFPMRTFFLSLAF
jgi:hypothetical protein